MTLNTEMRIDVAEGDVADFAADVLALKHARAFYGADGHVASRLIEAGERQAAVTPKNRRLLHAAHAREFSAILLS